MYKFRSSDVTNGRYIEAVEKHGTQLTNRYINLDLRDIREIIFYDEINDNVYNNCMIVLSIGDQLNIPITESEAKLLFFTLQVNRQVYLRECKDRITNLSQAKLMFDVCGGHYYEMTRQNGIRTDVEYVLYKFDVQCFLDGFRVFADIPITRIRDGETGHDVYTVVGGASTSQMNIMFMDCHITKQIHRTLYLKLFGNQIDKTFKSKDEVLELYPAEGYEQIFEDILSYIGFNNRLQFDLYSDCLFKYVSGSGVCVASPEYLICPEKDKEKQVYWKNISSYEWLLNINTDYIPLVQNKLQIWL